MYKNTLRITRLSSRNARCVPGKNTGWKMFCLLNRLTGKEMCSSSKVTTTHILVDVWISLFLTCNVKWNDLDKQMYVFMFMLLFVRSWQEREKFPLGQIVKKIELLQVTVYRRSCYDQTRDTIWKNTILTHTDEFLYNNDGAVTPDNLIVQSVSMVAG